MFHVKIHAITFGRMQHYTYLCIVKSKMNFQEVVLLFLFFDGV